MSQITSAIYASGELYTGGSAVITDLKGSGFTSVVAWAAHVQTNGDFHFNDTPIVQQGKYVGDPGWPELLAGLKQGTTSVNRLLFSFGGWESQDFPNMKALIFPNSGDYPDNPQIGPETILYQNFQALKNAIPTIDAIDYDDETLYDQPTTVALSRMLNGLGYHVTFCPFTNTSFWVDCLYQLNEPTPNLVTGFNLQCYAGGAENNPQDWISAIEEKMGGGFDAKGFVLPGLWCRHGNDCADGQCPASICSQFEDWQPSGIQGGFIWRYAPIQTCANSGACGQGISMNTAAYAEAVIGGLQG